MQGYGERELSDNSLERCRLGTFQHPLSTDTQLLFNDSSEIMKKWSLEKVCINKTSATFKVIVCFRSFLFQLEDHKPLCYIVVRAHLG